MRLATLLWRSLVHHRRANYAVIAGVATAAAVLGGALLVGESVRASLRRLALERIGNTETVIEARHLFRERLAQSFSNAVPLIAAEGILTHQSSSRRAGGIAVYAVDDRFWKFHGKPTMALENRDAALSDGLARELGAKPGETVLLRAEKPSDIPPESLFGRKDDASGAVRLNVKSVLAAGSLGAFSLRPSQGPVRAVFVPLTRLQRDWNAQGRVNTLLLGPASDPAKLLRSAYSLEDLGVGLRMLEDRNALQADTASGMLSPALATAALDTARALSLEATPVFTYMATAMRVGDREVPYSLIAAVDLAAVGVASAPEDAIVLNDWAARDLGVATGAKLTMEYLVWHDDGRTSNASAEFTVARVTPMTGLAGDRDLTPEYPGITDADNVREWDPPFPMDLGKIRPRDEDYWDQYRTTPKAFVTVDRARKLWGSRFGDITAIRLRPTAREEEGLEKALEAYRQKLRATLDPTAHGLTIIPLREQALAAASGSTDFGEYFTYFSFFLMVSALLLAGLFFRLGIEQRYAEIGLLRASGFSPAMVLRLFLAEGLVLAGIGAAVGIAGSLGYAALVLAGLGTFWIDAVGTRELSLAVAAGPLLAGSFGAAAAAAGTIYLTLRGIRTLSPRTLLAGGGQPSPASNVTRAPRAGAVCGVLALALLAATAGGSVPAAGGFFGAATLLLAAALSFFRGAIAASLRTPVLGPTGLRRLAFRNTGYRPGRAVLAVALIASATFLIVSLEAFRRDPNQAPTDRKSGTGGYGLLAESVRPLYHNPNTPEGRDALNLTLDGVRFAPFRLRPGDDASCLNLYAPRNPRVLGAPPAFLAEGRFAFARAEGDAANPWLLLDQTRPDGAIPAIADANSLMYALHKNIGDEIALPGGTRLRIVASLADSVFQSDLIIAEKHFTRVFPREPGFRVFLIEAPQARLAEVTAELERALADRGFDVVSAAERMAAFHRVENTYLSVFQTLGGLGLLVGTFGLAAVLFRNVIERRRDLALLAAVGYSPATLERLILTENLMLLAAGLGIGVGAAAIAIAPVLLARGPGFSLVSMAGMLAGVAAAGVVSTVAATRVAIRLPLLGSLRAG